MDFAIIQNILEWLAPAGWLATSLAWWSYRFNARKNNAGWRIDYFLVSDRLADKIIATPIYAEVMGSDHCPVGLDLDIG